VDELENNLQTKMQCGLIVNDRDQLKSDGQHERFRNTHLRSRLMSRYNFCSILYKKNCVNLHTFNNNIITVYYMISQPSPESLVFEARENKSMATPF